MAGTSLLPRYQRLSFLFWLVGLTAERPDRGIATGGRLSLARLWRRNWRCHVDIQSVAGRDNSRGWNSERLRLFPRCSPFSAISALVKIVLFTKKFKGKSCQLELAWTLTMGSKGFGNSIEINLSLLTLNFVSVQRINRRLDGTCYWWHTL